MASSDAIAVVGGGLSGSLVVLNVLRRAPDSKIILFEKKFPVGRGIAYGLPLAQHLLNVPAAKMSLYSDKSDHFLKWLHDHGHNYNAHDFAPRRLYGQYITETLTSAIDGKNVHLANEEVTSISNENGLWKIKTSRQDYEAGKIFIATGWTGFSSLASLRGLESHQDLYTKNPWDFFSKAKKFSGKEVLLVGSGLTAIDIALEAITNASVRVTLLSRHGLLPLAHAATSATPLKGVADGTAVRTQLRLYSELRVRTLLRDIRKSANSMTWQAAIDAVRSDIQSIWLKLSLDERRRFLRHAKSYWEVHRHRMAPSVAEKIFQFQKTGSLKIIAGRIVGARPLGSDLVEVELIPRGNEKPIAKNYAHIVNCLNPSENAVKNQPLLADLAAKGFLASAPLGMGVKTDEVGRCLNDQGRVTPGLFAVGPLQRGVLWEVTALPEIRNGIEKLIAATF
jgi:uncharacterized NAD(P)/FAD-binding protein YdhS